MHVKLIFGQFDIHSKSQIEIYTYLHFLLSKHNDNYGAKWLMSAVPCLNTHALHVHWPDLRYIYQSTKISIPGAGFKPGRPSAELTIPF